MTPVLTVEDVTKRFGSTTALDGVDLAVDPGEAVGLLGPNGAGKTTLLTLLTGLRRPDTGTVRLWGRDPREPAARVSLGLTPQATAVPAALKVREVVELVAAHYPAPPSPEALLARFDLADLRDRQCGALSGGQQRRLLVAVALVGDPSLLVLDEPTTGLDVESREVLWQVLRAFRREGGTLLLTTHYLAEVEALASRVVVIDHGQITADGTVDAIRRRVQLRRLRLVTSTDPAALATLPGVVDVSPERERPGSVTVTTRDSDAAVRALVSSGIPFADLEVAGATLEEAFLAMTSATARHPLPSGQAALPS